MAINQLKKHTGLTNRSIAQPIDGVSYSAVSQRYHRFSARLAERLVLRTMRRGKRMYGMLALLAAVACHQFHPQPIPHGAQLIPLDSRVIFDVHESYRQRDTTWVPVFELELRTKRLYPLCDFDLVAETKVKDGTVSTLIQGVYTDGCLTLVGPACYRIDLDLPPGRYEFKFLYRGMADRYRFNIKNDRVEIIDVMVGFTKCRDNLIWRRPVRSFVFLSGATTETSWICEDFIDTLTSEIHLEELHFKGPGRRPYPPSTCLSPQCSTPARYFHYHHDRDFDHAGAILRAHAKKATESGNRLLMILCDWTGREYVSWK